ncbi:unnamed protein product [Heterobilharzia americana]|nr:unnamed protein product [Heterobilharzia americana]
MSVDEQSFPSPPEDDIVDIFIRWFLILAAIIQLIFLFSAVFFSRNTASSHTRVVINRSNNLKKAKKQ